MKKILLSLLMLICIDIGCQAQLKGGVLLGLQPVQINEDDKLNLEQVPGIAANILNNTTAGFFVRVDFLKHFYAQWDFNASIDADWAYVSEGNSIVEDFSRVFENPNKLKLDAPLYLGGYLLRKKNFAIRAFVSPQFKIKLNKNFDYSPINFNDFSFNTGVGIDFLKYLTLNLNYRIPFQNGDVLFDKSCLLATFGIIF
jgi:hypothetical protein